MQATMTIVQFLLCGHAWQLRSIFVNFHLQLQPDTVIFVTRYIDECNDYYV